MGHPLEPVESKHSSHESLPTPPLSPKLSPAKPSTTGRHPATSAAATGITSSSREQSPSALEANLSPPIGDSPSQTPGTLGAVDYLGYFPPITPQTSHDPLLLKARLQTEDHITELRKRKGKPKSAAFYQKQNEHITGLLKHLDDHVREAEEEEDASRLAVRLVFP